MLFLFCGMFHDEVNEPKNVVLKLDRSSLAHRAFFITNNFFSLYHKKVWDNILLERDELRKWENVRRDRGGAHWLMISGVRSVFVAYALMFL